KAGMTTETRGWSEWNAFPRSSSFMKALQISRHVNHKDFRTGEGTAFDFCRFRTFKSERANPSRRHLLKDGLQHAYILTLFCGRKRTLV
ncbi:hypothetical protein OLZ32_38920, partial [Rhizobium sp. 1AS11]|uniref:hypothetical protein n=1 Tax=Rhizobium acaciae TaxID=2989736 RepID=UPI002223596F